MKYVLSVTILLVFGVTYTCAQANATSPKASPQPSVQPTPSQCNVCTNVCEFGHVMGADRCPTCTCITKDPWNPCMNYTCGINEWCENMDVQCVTAPCYPVAVCKQPSPGACPAAKYDPDYCSMVRVGRFCEMDKDCDMNQMCCEGDCGGSYCKQRECIVCAIFCEYGNVMGADGCPTCSCKDPWNPCMGAICGDGQWCENMQVQCVQEPCYPDPVCKPAKPGCMPVPPYDNEKCMRITVLNECQSDGDCWMDDGYGNWIPSICCQTECGGSQCVADGKPQPGSSVTIMVSLGTMTIALLSALIA